MLKFISYLTLYMHVFFRRILLASVLIILQAPLFAAQSTDQTQNATIKHVANKSTAINDQLKALKTAERVEVFFLKPYFESFRALEEPDLLKFGCKYESKNTEKVRNLVNIILESNLKENRKLPIRTGMIQGVYFYSSHERVGKVILGQFFTQDEYVTGMFNEKSVVGNHALSFQLYKWASEFPADSECADFVNNYKDEK